MKKWGYKIVQGLCHAGEYEEEEFSNGTAFINLDDALNSIPIILDSHGFDNG